MQDPLSKIQASPAQAGRASLRYSEHHPLQRLARVALISITGHSVVDQVGLKASFADKKVALLLKSAQIENFPFESLAGDEPKTLGKVLRKDREALREATEALNVLQDVLKTPTKNPAAIVESAITMLTNFQDALYQLYRHIREPKMSGYVGDTKTAKGFIKLLAAGTLAGDETIQADDSARVKATIALAVDAMMGIDLTLALLRRELPMGKISPSGLLSELVGKSNLHFPRDWDNPPGAARRPPLVVAGQVGDGLPEKLELNLAAIERVMGEVVKNLLRQYQRGLSQDEKDKMTDQAFVSVKKSQYSGHFEIVVVDLAGGYRRPSAEEIAAGKKDLFEEVDQTRLNGSVRKVQRIFTEEGTENDGGIGLTEAEQIAEAHGGFCRVENVGTDSDPKGFLFRMILPFDRKLGDFHTFEFPAATFADFAGHRIVGAVKSDRGAAG